jgi:hypothetical protein
LIAPGHSRELACSSSSTNKIPTQGWDGDAFYLAEQRAGRNWTQQLSSFGVFSKFEGTLILRQGKVSNADAV